MLHQLSLSVELFVTTCAIILLGSLGFTLVFGIVWHFFVLLMNRYVAFQLMIVAKFMTTNCALVIFNFVVNNFHMLMEVTRVATLEITMFTLLVFDLPMN